MTHYARNNVIIVGKHESVRGFGLHLPKVTHSAPCSPILRGVQVFTSLFPQRAISTHHSGPHHMRIVLASKARVGPTLKTAEHLVATTGHLFEDMITTCHEGAFRKLWKKQGVELHQQCGHDCRRC